jgi:predicted transcriptional regulator
MIRRILARMKTTASFTSTISPKLIKWVDNRARAQKRTRRVILEEAIRNYQRDAMKNILKSGFERAARDADMLELAEWGMSDYKHLAGRA